MRFVAFASKVQRYTPPLDHEGTRRALCLKRKRFRPEAPSYDVVIVPPARVSANGESNIRDALDREYTEKMQGRSNERTMIVEPSRS